MPWSDSSAPCVLRSAQRLSFGVHHVETQRPPSFRLVDSPSGVVAAPLQVVVPLGSTGETVLLTQSEDGSWWLGGALVTSGETAVRTENGNVYTLVMTTDAAGAIRWTAVRVRD